MSNIEIEDRMEYITYKVDEAWTLTDRDDLKDDCIKYVFDNWYSGSNQSAELIIEFLSMKCANVMSEADLKSMAIEDKERKVSSYEEATQGL